MNRTSVFAAVMAVILIAAAVAAVTVSFNTDDGGDGGKNLGANIIARVNCGGSGLFLSPDENPDDYLKIVDEKPSEGRYYEIGNGKYAVTYPEMWGGKVFGTFAESTDQFVQFSTIVRGIVGLPLLHVSEDGSELSDDAVYYTYAAGSAQYDTETMDGGYMWVPAMSICVASGCHRVAMSDELFPGTTCCVVACRSDFAKENSGTAVNFLKAYLESYEAMTCVIENKDSMREEYYFLVQVAVDRVFSDVTAYNTELKEASVKDAMDCVTYSVYDEIGDPLGKMKRDISEQIEVLDGRGLLPCGFRNLGYRSAEQFADALVDDSYLSEALKSDTLHNNGSTVKVACVKNCAHQLALHYGIACGIFEKYGINVEIVCDKTGPEAAACLYSGTADIAFSGMSAVAKTVLQSE